MLRISKLTDYGTLILTHMAGHPDRVHSATGLAEALGLGLPTVSKVLKTLGRHELVTSQRGAHGGYQLAKPSTDITAYDALVALEGTFNPMSCLANTAAEGESCLASGSCAVQEVWSDMKFAVEDVLKKKTLAHMIERQRESFKVPIRTYTSDSEIMQLVVLNN